MRPLPNVTIIKLVRLYPAPFCSITLTDLGTEVFPIKRLVALIYGGEQYG